MRRAHQVWSGIAAGVFCLVAIGDLSDDGTTTPTAAAPAAVSSAGPVPVAAPAPAASTAPAPVAAPSGDSVTVSEVIDGDTFVAGGRKVRVLGIDSCEASTYGGRQATSTAELLLDGQRVTLRSEPGVDEDRYDRLLRYVELPSGGDVAESMVIYEHTGVYEGDNDADAAYVEDLRDADVTGRTCSAPEYASGPEDDTDVDVDVPLPRRGDDGLPDGALSGGYCSKKWWC